jgi:hypothetical protein
MDRGLLFQPFGAMRRLLPLLVLAGCVTPSIPIPPPDPELMTFAVTLDGPSSQASFSYPPEINYVGAVVFVYNRDRRVGVIEGAHPDGSVGPTAPLAAALQEQIVVSFQRDDQTVSTCIRLRDGAQSATDYCGP